MTNIIMTNPKTNENEIQIDVKQYNTEQFVDDIEHLKVMNADQ